MLRLIVWLIMSLVWNSEHFPTHKLACPYGLILHRLLSTLAPSACQSHPLPMCLLTATSTHHFQRCLSAGNVSEGKTVMEITMCTEFYYFFFSIFLLRCYLKGKWWAWTHTNGECPRTQKTDFAHEASLIR